MRAQDGLQDALNHLNQHLHDLQTIVNHALGQNKAKEQLQSMLRPLDLCDAAAGLHDAEGI